MSELPPIPPFLLAHSVGMRDYFSSYLTAIREGEFGRAKDDLAKITRLVTLSYTVCDGLEKKRNHA
jgi:hypothetical protein